MSHHDAPTMTRQEVVAKTSAPIPARVYTITVEAVDASGNSSTATVDVAVEHDQRQKK